MIPITDSNIRELIESYFNGNDENLPPLNEWDVSQVTNMSELFDGRDINEPIDNWNVSNVTNMEAMFYTTELSQPLNINNWNVSNVTNMNYMFTGVHSFNQPLDNWNVSNVTTMERMFSGAISFNQPLDNWNVSNVTNMERMFSSASSFNQPLDNWNVSNVTNMKHMFMGASSFNQPLNNWNVSNVTDMKLMFASTAFNQPLNNWNVSNVTDMGGMFSRARAFNNDISNWTINQNANTESMFHNTRIREEFKPRMPRRVHIPAARQTPTGIAYQVHSAFNHIDFSKLFQLLNNGTIDIYSDEKPFQQYVIDELETILNNYTNADDKNELQQKFTGLLPKIRSINYDTNFQMSPNPSGVNAFFTILNFVKKQDKQYQDNYMMFFINDSYNAYDTGSDTSSCVKGIKERIVFALGQAGYNINNPIYSQISEILYPLKDNQLYSFIEKCIKKNKDTLLSLEDKTMTNKKPIILECVKNELRESFPNANIEELEGKIASFIENVQDMLEDESLQLQTTGGKRRRKTKKTTARYTKNTTRHKKNQSKKNKRRHTKRTHTKRRHS